MRGLSRLGDLARRGGERTGVRLFVVTDRSMEPALRDGDGLVTHPGVPARVGRIRVFEHPLRPGFWLVKRIAEIHDGTTMTVLSDNRDATIADSRTFGAVAIAGSYGVVTKVPARLIAR